jgi:hypothetical protein
LCSHKRENHHTLTNIFHVYFRNTTFTKHWQDISYNKEVKKMYMVFMERCCLACNITVLFLISVDVSEWPLLIHARNLNEWWEYSARWLCLVTFKAFLLYAE